MKAIYGAEIETLGEQYVPFASRLQELARASVERQILALVVQCMASDKRGFETTTRCEVLGSRKE